MTDNEIIKALECFALDKDFDDSQCIGCAFEHQFCTANMSVDIAKPALDLINRQKAEIERLQDAMLTIEECLDTMGFDETAIYCMQNDPEMTDCFKSNIKENAIREFAESLKKQFNFLEWQPKTTRKTLPIDFVKEQMRWVLQDVSIKTIDNLVKEMVGDTE